MTNGQVKQAFFDKTLTSIPFMVINGQGTPNTKVMYIDSSGKLTGQYLNQPGTQQQNDQGTYVLKSDGALCVTWQNWNSGQQVCVYAYNTANSYLFVDNQNNFHTAVMKDSIQSGNQLNNAGTTNTSGSNNNNNSSDNTNQNLNNIIIIQPLHSRYPQKTTTQVRYSFGITHLRMD